MPNVKTPDREKLSEKKRLIALFAAIAAVLVLLIVSVSLRISDAKGESSPEAAYIIQGYISSEVTAVWRLI